MSPRWTIVQSLRRPFLQQIYNFCGILKKDVSLFSEVSYRKLYGV